MRYTKTRSTVSSGRFRTLTPPHAPHLRSGAANLRRCLLLPAATGVQFPAAGDDCRPAQTIAQFRIDP
jgi:hypothetical protein